MKRGDGGGQPALGGGGNRAAAFTCRKANCSASERGKKIQSSS